MKLTKSHQILLRRMALGVIAPALVAVSAGLAQAQSTPPAADTPVFGQVGIGLFETARLNAFCPSDPSRFAGGVNPGPCVVNLVFHDLQGRTLKQVTLTLMPGHGGSLDIHAADVDRTVRPQVVPGIKVASRSVVLTTLELFDDATGTTRAVLGPVAPVFPAVQ